MSARTELGESYQAARRRTDASARAIAAKIAEDRGASIEFDLRVYREHAEAEAAAKTAWLDAGSATRTHNDSQNGQ